MLGEVAEGRHDGGIHVIVIDAGQRADVQLKGRVGGHDVNGPARAGHRLGDGHMGDGVRKGRQVLELGIVALVGSVDQARFGGFIELEGAHEARPHLVRGGGPAGGGQRRAHLGESLDGARASQRDRAVARVAPDVQAALGGTLFADNHDDAIASAAPTNMRPSHFGEGRVPREGVRLVVADPRDAESSSRLLVGGGHEHQGTRGRRAFLSAASDLAGHDGHRGGQVEHVDGAAPPHDVVLNLRAERIARPFRRIHGHDVRVPEEGQRRAGAARIRSFDRDHEGGAARMRGDPFD